MFIFAATKAEQTLQMGVILPNEILEQLIIKHELQKSIHIR